MYDFSIGVMLESFKLPIPEAIKKAKELGAEGIQVYATYGELSPHNLVGAKRKEFLDMVKSNGLVISALCGDLGKGFHDPAKNPELIEESKRILDLAKELETNVVTTHIGVVPSDPANERYQIMQKIGMSKREVKSSIRSQILMVFFLPLAMAIIHIAVAFPVITKLLAIFYLKNTKLFFGCTAGTVGIFAVFYVIVFVITAKEYYKIVE